MEYFMRKIRYSDLTSTLRIIFVCLFAAIISINQIFFGLQLGVLIIILIFLSDGLDGWLARKFDKQSRFGSFYDITADRITETVLLVPFVYLQIAHPLVLIFFIAKGFVVDYIRLKQFSLSKDVPFGQVQNPINKFLVSSRFMRFGYGFLKLLMIIIFYTAIFWVDFDKNLIYLVSLATVIFAMLRTVPIFADYWNKAYANL
jgi:CDP-diacylglycerol---glycerol-3-phosphate 3-phosphatidyltransferase